MIHNCQMPVFIVQVHSENHKVKEYTKRSRIISNLKKNSILEKNYYFLFSFVSTNFNFRHSLNAICNLMIDVQGAKILFRSGTIKNIITDSLQYLEGAVHLAIKIICTYQKQMGLFPRVDALLLLNDVFRCSVDALRPISHKNKESSANLRKIANFKFFFQEISTLC